MADSYHASVHTMLEQTRADEKEAASERTAMRDFLPQDTMGGAARRRRPSTAAAGSSVRLGDRLTHPAAERRQGLTPVHGDARKGVAPVRSGGP